MPASGIFSFFLLLGSTQFGALQGFIIATVQHKNPRKTATTAS